MSNYNNTGSRTKNAREIYVEQLPYGQGLTPCMNKKRRPFTHLNTADDMDLAYRSTPDYLRHLAHQDTSAPIELILAKNIPRTKSASEMTPRNNVNRSISGNPKYKAQEDYYDEIQSMKKEMKTVKDENSNLRAKIRRLEEDNARKRKEMDALYDTNKDGDLRRTLSGTSTDRNNNSSTANVVMSLKQRVFKLEMQLKQKETTIDEIKSDPRWTKSTELEVQNRALFSELERQKVARLNYLQQNDYTASLDEEQKNAVRKLTKEKDDLKKENESLKRKLHETDKSDRVEPLSARSTGRGNDKDLQSKIDDLQRDCNNYENELAQMKDDIKQLRRERNQFRDKLEQANEDLQEIKRDRDQYRKKFEQTNEDLESMQRERDKYSKINPTGRSSPALKRDEGPSKFDLNSRPSSPKTSLDGKKTVIPLKMGSRNLRDDNRINDHNNRVKSFREKRAATVIQREWRRHNKSRKPSLHDTSITRQQNSNKLQSPRSSTNFDNGPMRSRPTSANNSNEAALKTVQASLRGYLNRTEVGKNPRETPNAPSKSRSPTPSRKSQHNDSDDDDIVIPSSNERKRDSILDQPKSNSRQSLLNDKLGSNNRDLTNNMRRTPPPSTDRFRPVSPNIGSSKQGLPNDRIKLATNATGFSPPSFPRSASPPVDDRRPTSPRPGSGVSGSKQSLLNDRNKLGSNSRIPTNDRESNSKLTRPFSPSNNDQRPASPSTNNSKQNLPNDQNKFGSGSRIRPNDRDSSSKLTRPSSPSNDRPTPRKSPSNSKSSIRDIPEEDDDDDDVI
ncbi:unnamed protein product [Adineta steineri]|uniref:Uncharacterized protein n=1 Tax=Adineta steineri TaxID=433720 RepID=A0A813UCF5_9BILA|nr:unnamed protein product [Adineta steineri]